MIWHQAPDNSVTSLMIGGVALLFVAHHHGLALGAHHDFVLGHIKLFLAHGVLVGTGSKQGRLVDQVSQVSTGEAGRTASNNRWLNVVRYWHLTHVHFKNLFTTTDVWQTNHHLTVKTTGAQQGRVKHVGTVSCRNHNNTVVCFKAIHLDQQLVQGLLTLIMATAHTGTTVTTHSINLVDKDDARCLLFGLFEHVTNPRSTHTHEHLYEVRTGDGEKRYFSFAGNRFGNQGFTSSRWANHQHTSGNTAAQTLELARIFQEVNQLLYIFLGLFNTRHVGKRGFDLVFRQQACLALAKAHGATATTTAALHLAHKEHKHRKDNQNREAGH